MGVEEDSISRSTWVVLSTEGGGREGSAAQRAQGRRSGVLVADEESRTVDPVRVRGAGEARQAGGRTQARGSVNRAGWTGELADTAIGRCDGAVVESLCRWVSETKACRRC